MQANPLGAVLLIVNGKHLEEDRAQRKIFLTSIPFAGMIVGPL
jgi:hypothetical protein